jgi:hypothetical protein
VSGFRWLLTNVFSRQAPEAGVVFVREADFESQIFDALRCTNGGWMHDRVAISWQQTTDSDGSSREPRAIRNELSKRHRRDSFAGVYTSRPDADRTSRIQRGIYDRCFGLRPTASLSGFLRDAGRQLHGARRRRAVSVTRSAAAAAAGTTRLWWRRLLLRRWW